MPISNKAIATSLALLAAGPVAATVPALTGAGGTSTALGADVTPPDDLTDDGTQPAPAAPADPAPGPTDDLTGVTDDLSDDGTQPAPPPPADPGPGTFDDLSNDGTQPAPP